MRAIVRIHRTRRKKSAAARGRNSSSSHGSESSPATLYVAWDDVDHEREGPGPRPLFTNAGHDDLSHYGADRYLTGGMGAPAKDDLIHISVRFYRGDFDALGETDEEREAALRDVTRVALGRFFPLLRDSHRTLKSYRYYPGRRKSELKIKWVAGFHNNTKNPHVHVLVHKEMLETGGVGGSERVL